MASDSSARGISYDLRPAKQRERRMMVDCLATATEVGFDLSSYRYVGMGGNRFYDFRIMHKYFRIERMVSLEHDRQMFHRAEFNRPFGFISVNNRSVGDFLLEDRTTGGSIYWLDYDACIGPRITNDVVSLGRKATAGDFVFVTVDARPPKHLRREGTAYRLAELRTTLGDFAVSLKVADVEDSGFWQAADKVLSSALRRGFRGRKDGVFRMFFRVRYRDSVEMITLGGVFDSRDRCERLVGRLEERMPFLAASANDLYSIGQFNYTEKERGLLDLAATAPRKNAKQIGQLHALGIGPDEISTYKELLRYHPRYVETFV